MLRIHICDSRGMPQSNSMPPSAGTLGRNISPTVCCSDVSAISTLKSCGVPSRVMMTSFSFGSSGCGPVGLGPCATAGSGARANSSSMRRRFMRADLTRRCGMPSG